MSEAITFTIDGEEVTAEAGESIWQVAKRHGKTIPHLCYTPMQDYRADGNCRICMVEIEGERTLAASCIREPAPGMVVKIASRTRRIRPQYGAGTARRRSAGRRGGPHHHVGALVLGRLHGHRYLPVPAPRCCSRRSQPSRHGGQSGCLHPLQPLCTRLPRDPGQRCHRHGLSRQPCQDRLSTSTDPMGESTCVACGECVQACPTGALMEKTLIDETASANRPVQGSRQRLPLLRRRLPAHLQVEGQHDRGGQGQGRPVQSWLVCV